MEEFMEFELSGIFPVKLVTKNIVCGSPGTQFMHVRVKGKEIFKFKDDNKNVNFPTQFCLRSISNGFSTTESRELYLNDDVCDFLDIHKYLQRIIKNNAAPY